MGFKEIDRIYLNEGDRIEFRKIVEKYKLKEIKNIHVDIKGFIDEWVWFPIEKYNKSFYINDNMILMETNPPFLYKGESVEFEHTSKVKKENSEGFIVFELNI